MTPLGLQLVDGISFEEWERVGEWLLGVADTLPWLIGDWLANGEWRYGTKYKVALERLELEYDRVRDWAYVAGNVPLAVRRRELSWKHHRHVAKLVPKEQEVWLQRALDGGWTHLDLAEQLKRELAPASQTSDAPDLEQLRLTFEAWRVARWQAAAQLEDADVVEWLAGLADEAASRKLGAPIPNAG